MSKLLFVFIFILFHTVTFSQAPYPYEEIELLKPSDYKQYEPMALSAANFLLSTPYKKGDNARERAFNFLVKWTAGDQDYDFRLRGIILDLVQEKELMTLFIPAMVKFCLENKALGNNGDVIETNAVAMVVSYCDNPANNFILKKKFRKRMGIN